MICKSYEPFFRTIADKTKLDIINLLSKGQLSVNEICQKLKLEQSRVSHNLKTLADRHFVSARISGKSRIYSLDTQYIIPILKLIDRHVARYYKNYCKCKGIPWREKR